jgi:thiosulfate/3-mercaptopyruvate sulfurtransferase
MDTLVPTDWLDAELGAADLCILDATWFLPAAGRDARAEYEAGHIAGAAFVDIDAVSDPDSPFPHMLPPAHLMASRMQALGVRDGARIVVYDNSPLHTGARVWWMLRAFGARRVALLDGGLAKWTAEGRPLERGAAPLRRGHFTPVLEPDRVAGKAEVASLIGASTEIVDARSAARFAGAEAEPRPRLAAGHMPGAKNLPQGLLFNSDNSWKRGDALRAEFERAGVDLERPMVTTCGSGVTAAVLLFGAHLLGKDDVRLYDGSWSEWGADADLPKETGAV